MDFIIIIVISILFGALIRTVFGFGEALVTMPILSLIGLDLKLSISIVGIVGVLVAFPKFVANRRLVDWKIVNRLLIGSVIGTPIGILMIIYIDETIVLFILGILLITYGLINLFNLKLATFRSLSYKSDYMAGFISGTLGAAYNSHGVPIVVYGTLRKWNVNKIKQISQVHFFIVGLIVITNHAISRFWTIDLLYLLLIVLPLLIPTIKIGDIIANKVDNDTLIKYVYTLLIIFGILMIFRK